MDMASLERVLDTERAEIDSTLEEIAAGARARVAPALADAVVYALSTRGKRLRPILCLAACRAAGGQVTAATRRLALATEIVHTYSLVHDDLPCMDDDEMRRGRPTVHRVHGTALATLAGAALLPLAVSVLIGGARELGLDRATEALLVSELCGAAGAGGMVGGQLRDLEAERVPVDGVRLEGIHRAKTGALLTASLRIGALAAGATAGMLQALTEYGQALGLAFQIADDVLDVVGDAESLGKVSGRDKRLEKASYPGLYGLEGAQTLAREKADEAKTAIGHIDAPELSALADYVVERQR